MEAKGLAKLRYASLAQSQQIFLTVSNTTGSAEQFYDTRVTMELPYLSARTDNKTDDGESV
jgi:hypothetical protein